MKPWPLKPDTLDDRLMSLDVLRGFDMFWIVGGAQLVRQVGRAADWPWGGWVAAQMRHAPWQGFHFFDLIFPLFMFVSGVSIPYAITRRRENGVPLGALARKILWRVLVLMLLGLVYNGLLDFDFARLRWASVLGQIGVAYGIAAAITLASGRPTVSVAACLAIMASVAAVQLLVPVPGHGPGVLTPQGSINGYIDRMFLPGRLYGRLFDPEGLLCMLSATATTLLGVACGQLLRLGSVGAHRKTLILVAAGGLLLAAGMAVWPLYPPIKKVWTSTFTLLAGGSSMMLMALFFLLIDVWRFRRWGLFFYVIGLNSITIYMAVKLVDFKFTADLLLGGAASRCGPWEPALLTGGALALEWLLLWALYRKGIFFRV
jgi:predicted acyltransferase